MEPRIPRKITRNLICVGPDGAAGSVARSSRASGNGVIWLKLYYAYAPCEDTELFVPAQGKLTESASILLDAIRFSAALLVVAAHAGHPEFDTGYRDYQYLGDIAVPTFFVLSGFIIRYITKTRVHSARDFFIDRASRMYSVVLPTMALTLLLSLACHWIAPAYYNANFRGSSNHPVARIVLNLLFLSQVWGHNTVPFLDGPFWSLGFECLYYVAFGIMLFCKGNIRIAALVILGLVLDLKSCSFSLYGGWVVGSTTYISQFAAPARRKLCAA